MRKFLLLLAAMTVSLASMAHDMTLQRHSAASQKSVSVKAVRHTLTPSKKVQQIGKRQSASKTSGFAGQFSKPVTLKAGNPFCAPTRLAQMGGSLFGALVYDADNNDCLGLWDMGVNSYQPKMLWAQQQVNFGGFSDGLKVYQPYLLEFWGIILGANFTTYDALTGEQIDEVNMEATHSPVAATWMPTSSMGLVNGQNIGTNASELYTIDVTTGETNVVATLDLAFTGGMASASDGRIWGMTAEGAIYKINSDYSISRVATTTATSDYLSAMTYSERSGKLLVATCLEDENSALYEVDPVTGTTELRYTMNSIQEYAFLFIPKGLADDNAPAAPSDVAMAFADGSLSGTVTFTAPAELYSGQAASGSVDYTIAYGDNLEYTGSTTYGAATTATITVPAKGEYTFEVRLRNGAGASPVSSVSGYIGPDSLNPVSGLSMTANGSEHALSWEAPTPVHGGYVDTDQVQYTVTRYVGLTPTVLTTTLKATSYTDNYTPAATGLQIVYYSVEATYDGTASAPVLSNSKTYGVADTPFTPALNNKSLADAFIILDNNDDESTWSYGQVSGEGVFRYAYDSDNDADDYLILPPVHLEAGKIYTFSTEAGAQSLNYPESIALAVGTQPTAAAMQTILDSTLLTEKASTTENGFTGQTLSAPYVCTQTGTYYFAVQATSPADSYYIFAGKMSVSAGSSAEVPAQVNALTLTSDPTGAKKVTVSFQAPSLNAMGQTLSSLTKIEVLRDGSLVKTFDNPTPGQSLSFVDTPEENGQTTYTVTASNSFGAGLSVSESVYVGINVPSAVQNFVARRGGNGGEVVLTWDAVTTDIQGNPAGAVTYTLLKANYETEQWEVLADGITATTYSFQAVSPTAPQDIMEFAIIPANATGSGTGTPYEYFVPVGRAYSMPYLESMQLETIMGIHRPAGSKGSFAIASDTDFEEIKSYDHDGAMAVFQAQNVGDEAMLYSGAIAVTGTNAALSFYYFGDTVVDSQGNIHPDENWMQIYINSGDGFLPVGEKIEFAEGILGDWNLVQIPLDQFVGKDIQFGINIVAVNNSTEFIDHIEVRNMVDHDMAVETVMPVSVKAGTTLSLPVVVNNLGTTSASGWSLTMYVDHVAVDTKTGVNLASAGSKKVNMRWAVPTTAQDEITVEVVVNYPDDENPANNSTGKQTIKVIRPTFPAVTDLSVQADGQTAQFSWTEPDYASYGDEYVETFEDCDSFAGMNSGNTNGWTLLDLDGKGVGGMQNLDIPGITIDTPYSWFIMDGEALSNQSMMGHDSAKSLCVLFNYNSEPNDDWAISPELSGDAQQISFWARAYSSDYPETLEILYSTTDRQPSSFTSLKTIKNISTQNMSWTQYTADLPQGAKYFALRFISEDTFMLMVDDVAFIPAGMKPLTLLGYNIYRDGLKLNDAPLTGTTYTDTFDGTNVGYTVTALYDAGESAASNLVYPFGNSVEGLQALRISAGRGFLLISGTDAPVSVTDMAGRTIYRGAAGRIPASAGTYIVATGATRTKVLVK